MTGYTYQSHDLRCDYPPIGATYDPGRLSKRCRATYVPPADAHPWPRTLGDVRKLAAKAGWIYVRHPRVRALDSDYCPEHGAAGRAELAVWDAEKKQRKEMGWPA